MSSLFKLLKTFNIEELKSFESFINSPYFNTNKYLNGLFELLRNEYFINDSNEPDKKKLFKKLFGNEPFEDSKLRVLFHQLHKLLFKFITLERFNSEILLNQTILLDELDIKNLNIPFKSTAKNIEKYIENEGVDTEEYYNLYVYSCSMFNNYLRNQKLNRKLKIESLVELSDNSMLYIMPYFFVQTIRFFVNLSIQSIKFDQEIKDHFINKFLAELNIDEIIKLIREKDNKTANTIELYNYLYKLYKNIKCKSLDHYNRYKIFFNENYNILSREERSYHFTRMLSFLTIYDNNLYNNVNIDRELQEIYDQTINDELYKNKLVNYLPPDLFRAALLIGYRRKDNEWMKNYIKLNVPKLPPKHKKNLNNFASAYYYFMIKDYGRSLEYMNKIVIQYFLFKFDINILKLKVFYECNYTEELYSAIHSYRQLLSDDKLLSVKNKKCHLNFLTSLSKLIVIKDKNDKTEIEYSILTLEKDREIFHKNWLIEKYKELLDKII